MTDGWAYRFPGQGVAIRKDGKVTEYNWGGKNPPLVVRYQPGRVTYHSMDGVVFHDLDGKLIYQQPKGTMHQEQLSVIYHWCEPNVIGYHTVAGVVYHDFNGITYQGPSGTFSYNKDGSVGYHGIGGVTRTEPDGTTIHWTEMGLFRKKPTGEVTFTKQGSSIQEPINLDNLEEPVKDALTKPVAGALPEAASMAVAFAMGGKMNDLALAKEAPFLEKKLEAPLVENLKMVKPDKESSAHPGEERTSPTKVQGLGLLSRNRAGSPSSGRAPSN